ncbi:hypothetical protein KEM48_003635 [Puccinia striiformis f. sp. tritici PST-130]|nr:hypothetical protein KEM48_003635 [Puccinia striiformis f. sp. tritici PST-130]
MHPLWRISYQWGFVTRWVFDLSMAWCQVLDCKDGDIEDAPGLNALQSFKVIIEDEQVYIEVDPEIVKATQFGRKPVKCKSSATTKPIKLGCRIGGGSGGHYFVEEIEVQLPHSNLSLQLIRSQNQIIQGLITDPKKIAFRDEDFYRETEIDLKIGKRRENRHRGKSVSLSDGSTIKYSKLVVATGGIPRTLPLDGSELEGINILRTISDSQKIQSLISGASSGEKKTTIALIGSSFISMELAIFAAKKDNVIIGNAIRKSHEKNGVIFHLEANLEKFVPSESKPSHVGGVALKGGEVIKVDGVVLGVGVRPNTDLLKASGIALEKDGSVVVDEYLRIKDSKAHNDIYAIGDIAKYPDLLTDGALVRIAQGEQLRYVGTGKASQWEDVFIDGDLDQLCFVAYYFKNDQVVAVATIKKIPLWRWLLNSFLDKNSLRFLRFIRKGMNLMSVKL